MLISIVIPNYNGEKLLQKNLPLLLSVLLKEKKYDFEIILIDDASKDASVSFLESFAKEHSSVSIEILKNEKNLGFSSTVNKAVSQTSGLLILLLNSDVVPEENFLEPLIRHFKNENVFAVGCLDKSIESGKTVLRGRGVGKWEKGFLMHAAGSLDKTNTLWVSCGSGMFRKSIWEKLGGLSELYNPFYWEDIDLSYRAMKSGFTILFEPESIVKHEHEKGAIKSSYSEFEIKTIAYRNQFIFVWKNITDTKFLLSHIAWLPYHFLTAAMRRDGVFFMGFIKAFFLLSKIVSKDRIKFTKSDKEALKNLDK